MHPLFHPKTMAMLLAYLRINFRKNGGLPQSHLLSYPSWLDKEGVAAFKLPIRCNSLWSTGSWMKKIWHIIPPPHMNAYEHGWRCLHYILTSAHGHCQNIRTEFTDSWLPATFVLEIFQLAPSIILLWDICQKGSNSGTQTSRTGCNSHNSHL